MSSEDAVPPPPDAPHPEEDEGAPPAPPPEAPEDAPDDAPEDEDDDTPAPPPPPAHHEEFDMTVEQAKDFGKKNLGKMIWDLALYTQVEAQGQGDAEVPVPESLTQKAFFAIAIFFYDWATQGEDGADFLDVEWTEPTSPQVVDFAKEAGVQITDTYAPADLKQIIAKKLDSMIAASDGVDKLVSEMSTFAFTQIQTQSTCLGNLKFRRDTIGPVSS